MRLALIVGFISGDWSCYKKGLYLLDKTAVRLFKKMTPYILLSIVKSRGGDTLVFQKFEIFLVLRIKLNSQFWGLLLK